ncbi:MAG: response regulator transcription factor [Alphaproteobacteria bacterium]
MRSQPILVIDDDPGVREVVRDCLEDAGFVVIEAATGSDGLSLAGQHPLGAVILDLGLPDMEGLTITQTFRQSYPGVGLIILTGRSASVERIVGLEIGADDYVCKPFEPRELLARLRSVLRRLVPPAAVSAPAVSSDRYRFAGFVLDTGTSVLLGNDGDAIPLSSAEYALIKALAEKPNRVLSREQIIDLTHTNDAPAFDRSVDVTVARLRKKIDLDPDQPSLIKTVRNQGYLLSARVERG